MARALKEESPLKNLSGGKALKIGGKEQRSPDLWKTRDIPIRFDWVSKSKEDRARKRVTNDTVEPRGEDGDSWSVWGMVDLSDRFEVYHVTRGEDGNFGCSCQSHAHGDARGFCSHQLACAIWDYENGRESEFPRFGLVVESVEKFDWYKPVTVPSRVVRVEEMNDGGPPRVTITTRLYDEDKEIPIHDPWSVTGEVTWSRKPRYSVEYVGVYGLPVIAHPDQLVAISLDGQQLQWTPAPTLSPDEVEEGERPWYDFSIRPEILDLQLEDITPRRWRLPAKVEQIRPLQFLGVKQTVENWHDRKKFVFANVPTGGGKTNLGVMAAMEITGFCSNLEEYRTKGKSSALYVATDRALQDQFWGDYEDCFWSAILKGRRNYKTANFPDRYAEDFPGMPIWDKEKIISCEDCEFKSKKQCRYCDPPGHVHNDDSSGSPCLGRCPYKQAVRKLVRSLVGCMNTPYLVRAASSPAWGQFEGKKVLVVDEADLLESTIMGFVEIEIPEYRLGRIQMGRPRRKTVPTTWIDWAEEAIGKIGYLVTVRAQQIKEPGNHDLFENPDDKRLYNNDKLLNRDLKYWTQTVEQIRLMYASLQKGEPWIYDCKTDKEEDVEQGPVVFKPVLIGQFCEELLWKHFDFVLLMSGTLPPPHHLAKNLGINIGNVGYVDIPSSFDPSRCPIYICPIAENSYSKKEESYPVILEAILRAIDARPGIRILIHSVSYQQSEKFHKDISEHCDGRPVIRHDKGIKSKHQAIAQYKMRPDSILISPTMNRGVDFKDDLLRFQIITKMAFGNLADKQIAARLYGTPDGQQNYTINVVGETEQMWGRCMRHEQDWGETLILDAKFRSVWCDGEEFFHANFKKSMIWVQPSDLDFVLANGFGARFR